jgi:hypothetical protein
MTDINNNNKTTPAAPYYGQTSSTLWGPFTVTENVRDGIEVSAHTLPKVGLQLLITYVRRAEICHLCEQFVRWFVTLSL